MVPCSLIKNFGPMFIDFDEIVTKYPGYPINVYNKVSSDKKYKKGKRHDMDGSESIVSVVYIRKYILAVITYLFITGMSRTKNMEHILERKADFESFKNGARVIERTCNTINSSISLWKEYLETMMENNLWLCESESDSHHWLSLDGLKYIISMNPYEHFLSEELRTKKKVNF